MIFKIKLDGPIPANVNAVISLAKHSFYIVNKNSGSKEEISAQLKITTAETINGIKHYSLEVTGLPELKPWQYAEVYSETEQGLVKGFSASMTYYGPLERDINVMPKVGFTARVDSNPEEFSLINAGFNEDKHVIGEALGAEYANQKITEITYGDNYESDNNQSAKYNEGLHAVRFKLLDVKGNDVSIQERFGFKVEQGSVYIGAEPKGADGFIEGNQTHKISFDIQKWVEITDLNLEEAGVIEVLEALSKVEEVPYGYNARITEGNHTQDSFVYNYNIVGVDINLFVSEVVKAVEGGSSAEMNELFKGLNIDLVQNALDKFSEYFSNVVGVSELNVGKKLDLVQEKNSNFEGANGLYGSNIVEIVDTDNIIAGMDVDKFLKFNFNGSYAISYKLENGSSEFYYPPVGVEGSSAVIAYTVVGSTLPVQDPEIIDPDITPNDPTDITPNDPKDPTDTPDKPEDPLAEVQARVKSIFSEDEDDIDSSINVSGNFAGKSYGDGNGSTAPEGSLEFDLKNNIDVSGLPMGANYSIQLANKDGISLGLNNGFEYTANQVGNSYVVTATGNGVSDIRTFKIELDANGKLRFVADEMQFMSSLNNIVIKQDLYDINNDPWANLTALKFLINTDLNINYGETDNRTISGLEHEIVIVGSNLIANEDEAKLSAGEEYNLLPNDVTEDGGQISLREVVDAGNYQIKFNGQVGVVTYDNGNFKIGGVTIATLGSDGNFINLGLVSGNLEFYYGANDNSNELIGETDYALAKIELVGPKLWNRDLNDDDLGGNSAQGEDSEFLFDSPIEYKASFGGPNNEQDLNQFSGLAGKFKLTMGNQDVSSLPQYAFEILERSVVVKSTASYNLSEYQFDNAGGNQGLGIDLNNANLLDPILSLAGWSSPLKPEQQAVIDAVKLIEAIPYSQTNEVKFDRQENGNNIYKYIYGKYEIADFSGILMNWAENNQAPSEYSEFNGLDLNLLGQFLDAMQGFIESSDFASFDEVGTEGKFVEIHHEIKDGFDDRQGTENFKIVKGEGADALDFVGEINAGEFLRIANIPHTYVTKVGSAIIESGEERVAQITLVDAASEPVKDPDGGDDTTPDVEITSLNEFDNVEDEDDINVSDANGKWDGNGVSDGDGSISSTPLTFKMPEVTLANLQLGASFAYSLITGQDEDLGIGANTISYTGKLSNMPIGNNNYLYTVTASSGETKIFSLVFDQANKTFTLNPAEFQFLSSQDSDIIQNNIDGAATDVWAGLTALQIKLPFKVVVTNPDETTLEIKEYNGESLIAKATIVGNNPLAEDDGTMQDPKVLGAGASCDLLKNDLTEDGSSYKAVYNVLNDGNFIAKLNNNIDLVVEDLNGVISFKLPNSNVVIATLDKSSGLVVNNGVVDGLLTFDYGFTDNPVIDPTNIENLGEVDYAKAVIKLETLKLESFKANEDETYTDNAISSKGEFLYENDTANNDEMNIAFGGYNDEEDEDATLIDGTYTLEFKLVDSQNNIVSSGANYGFKILEKAITVSNNAFYDLTSEYKLKDAEGNQGIKNLFSPDEIKIFVEQNAGNLSPQDQDALANAIANLDAFGYEQTNTINFDSQKSSATNYVYTYNFGEYNFESFNSVVANWLNLANPTTSSDINNFINLPNTITSADVLAVLEAITNEIKNNPSKDNVNTAGGFVEIHQGIKGNGEFDDRFGSERFEIKNGVGADGLDIQKLLELGEFMNILVPHTWGQLVGGVFVSQEGISDRIVEATIVEGEKLPDITLIDGENTKLQDDNYFNAQIDGFANNNTPDPSNIGDNGIVNQYAFEIMSILKLPNGINPADISIENNSGNVLKFKVFQDGNVDTGTVIDAAITFSNGRITFNDQDIFKVLKADEYAVLENEFSFNVKYKGVDVGSFDVPIEIDGSPRKLNLLDVKLTDDEVLGALGVADNSYIYEDLDSAIQGTDIVFNLDNPDNVKLEGMVGAVTKEFKVIPDADYKEVPKDANNPSAPQYYYKVTAGANAGEYVYTMYQKLVSNTGGITYQPISPVLNDNGVSINVNGITNNLPLFGVTFKINPDGKVDIIESAIDITKLKATENLAVHFTYELTVTDQSGQPPLTAQANATTALLGITGNEGPQDPTGGDPVDPFDGIDKVEFVEDEDDILNAGNANPPSGVYYGNGLTYVDQDASQVNPNTLMFQLDKGNASIPVQGYTLVAGNPTYFVDGIEVRLYQPVGSPANQFKYKLESVPQGNQFKPLEGKEFTIIFDAQNATITLVESELQALKADEVFKFGLKYAAILQGGKLSKSVDANMYIVGTSVTALDDNLNAIANGQAQIVGNILINDTDTDGDDVDVREVINAVFIPQVNNNGTVVSGAPINLTVNTTIVNGVNIFTLTGNGMTIEINGETGVVTYNGAIPGQVKFSYISDGSKDINNNPNQFLNGLADNGEQDIAEVTINCGFGNPPVILNDNIVVADDEDDIDTGGIVGVTPGGTQYADKNEDINNDLTDLRFKFSDVVTNNIPVVYKIVTGSYIVDGMDVTVSPTAVAGVYSYEITSGAYAGRVFELVHNGGQEFAFRTADMQFLNDKEAIEFVLKYNVTDSNGLTSADAKATIGIVGNSNDKGNPPVILNDNIVVADDEDDIDTGGIVGVTPGGTQYADKNEDINNDLTDLRFKFSDVVTNNIPVVYKIVTGSYIVDGMDVTVSPTAVAGVYSYEITSGAYAGRVFELVHNGGQEFAFRTADMQFLNDKEAIEFVLKYNVTDSNGLTSADAKATIGIVGNSNDNPNDPPEVPEKGVTKVRDDEDGIIGVSNDDGDNQGAGKLAFLLPASDPNGDPLIYSAPASVLVVFPDGTTRTIGISVEVINGLGYAVFDPAEFQDLKENESVTFKFDYQVEDPSGASAESDITITIDGVSPVALFDNWTNDIIGAGQTSIKSVFDNDSDADGDAVDQLITVTNAFLDGNAAQVVANPDGTFSFFFDNKEFAILQADGKLKNLGVFNANEFTFAYTADSLPGVATSLGEQASANVVVCLHGGNNPPEVPEKGVTKVRDDEDGIIGVSNDDGDNQGAGKLAFLLPASDPNGDPLIYSAPASVLVVFPDGTTRTIGISVEVINGLGYAVFDPAEFQDLKENESVTFKFDYQVEDPSGASAESDITITIDGVGVVANDDNFTNNEYLIGQSTTSILANDNDPDGDSLEIISVTNASIAGQALAVELVNGAYQLKLGNDLVATVNADGTITRNGGPGGDLKLTYKVDGLPNNLIPNQPNSSGEEDTAEVIVKFYSGPETPFGVTKYADDEDGLKAVNPNDSIGVNGELKFVLPASSNNGPLTYTVPATVTVNGMVYSIINNNDGTINLVTEELQWLSQGQIEAISIDYTVTDVNGVSANGTVLISIHGGIPNATDDLLNIKTTSFGVIGNIITGDNGNGVDIDPDGDALEVIKVENAKFNGNIDLVSVKIPNGSFNLLMNGVVIANVAKDGTVSYNGSAQGTITFSYTVDGKDNGDLVGEQDSANVTIIVEPCGLCTGGKKPPVFSAMDYVDDENAKDNSGLVGDKDDGLNQTLAFEIKVTDPDTALTALKYTINGVNIANNNIPQTLTYNGIAGHPIDLTFSFINGKPHITVDKADVQYLLKDEFADLTIPVLVSDGSSSISTNMKVRILGDNPMANDDNIDVIVGNSGNIGNIVSNDVNDDNDHPLEIIEVSNPKLGAVDLTVVNTNNGFELYNGASLVAVVKTNGDVELQPNLPVTTITFDYKIDGDNPNNLGEQDSGMVTINIKEDTNNNNKPVAQDTTNVEDEDAITSSIVGTWNGNSFTDENDTAQANSLTFKLQATDADNDPLTYSIETGIHSYDGVDVTVELVGGGGGTNSTNGQPVNAVVALYKVTFGANAGIHAGKVFDVTLNQNTGEYSFDKSQFQYLQADQAINIQLRYKASDGKDVSNIALANNIIVGRDINAVDDNIPIFENKITTIQVLANDNDPDGGELFIKNGSITSITIKGPNAINRLSPSIHNATGLTVQQNGDVMIAGNLLPLFLVVAADNKTISFDSEFFKLEPNQTANVEFDYIATDSPNGGMGGEEDSATVTLVVSDNPDDNTTTVGDPSGNPNNPNDDSITLVTEDETENDPEEVSSTSETVTPNKDYEDDIVNGNEDDNIVSGDVKDLTLSVKSGNAYAKANPVTFGGDEFAEANTDAIMSNGEIIFGNDEVNAGNGDDLTLGDVNKLLIKGQQGDATAIVDDGCSAGIATASANVKFENNILNFGNDLLQGGKGDDHVIGDAKEIAIEYSNGTNVTQGDGASVNDDDMWLNNNEFNFGNDIIEGGKENDMLTGDVYKFTVNGQEYFITGDINSVTALQDALDSQGVGNMVNFGNDTFRFNFANGATGDDIITDFGQGDDKIEIQNLNINGQAIDTLAKLQSNSIISQDANGNAVLAIDLNGNGVVDDHSSMTFQGVSEAELIAKLGNDILIFS